MNRIEELFKEKQKDILSVYFTAGYPSINDTVKVIEELEKNGVDLMEIGIPFSDPLADGPVIQRSSEIALENGMTLKLLFQQLKGIRNKVKIPLLLMGYLNPVLQYGIEKFCKEASEIGVDGVILPDLPFDEYINEYKAIFDKYNLFNIFLVTPQTSEKRIRMIDENSKGFVYLVSSSSTTGSEKVQNDQQQYFERMKQMKLKNPTLIGFGISSSQSFKNACEYANGAIIGSAFIKAISETNDLKSSIKEFIKKINSQYDHSIN